MARSRGTAQREALRIEYVPLASVARWPRNPKEHDLPSLRRSFARFGFVAPILLDEGTGKIVAGHGRLDSLLEAQRAGAPAPDRIEVRNGDWFVPVVRGVAFKSPEEAEAYLIADNRLTMAGGWDEEALAGVLGDLRKAGGLEGIGFGEGEVERILKALGGPGKTEVILDQAVQLRPAREYVVVMAGDEQEWEQLKEALDLKPVRKGGYKPGSPFDNVSTNRVIHAKDLLERLAGPQPVSPPGPWALRPGTADSRILKETEGYFRHLKVEEGDRVLDLGAHIGGFAVRAALRGAKVWAVEPEPANCALLRQNVEAKRVRDRVEVLEVAAVVGTLGETALYLARGTNTGNQTLRHTRGRESILVRSRDIQEIMAQAAPTIVKMDCESAEFELAQAMEWEGVRLALIEVHPGMLGEEGEGKAREVRQHLEKAGLRIKAQGGVTPGLRTLLAWRP